MESLGIENVVAKSIGSNNSLNMAKAALNGLLKLKKQSDVEERRGIKLNIRPKSSVVDHDEEEIKNGTDKNEANN